MPDKHLATAEGTVEGEAAAEDAAEAVHDSNALTCPKGIVRDVLSGIASFGRSYQEVEHMKGVRA